MPREWQKIAAEDPERFAKLQHDFISDTHYTPALKEIQERTGIDLARHQKTLQEVLWSTAVQHGARGAANILCRAIGRAGSEPSELNPTRLIEQVYRSRSNHFGSSSARVAQAVRDRFKQEKASALALLAEEMQTVGRSQSIS
jgi:hypothetical protein